MTDSAANSIGDKSYDIFLMHTNLCSFDRFRLTSQVLHAEDCTVHLFRFTCKAQAVQFSLTRLSA
jgi:hypothetical protein